MLGVFSWTQPTSILHALPFTSSTYRTCVYPNLHLTAIHAPNLLSWDPSNVLLPLFPLACNGERHPWLHHPIHWLLRLPNTLGMQSPLIHPHREMTHKFPHTRKRHSDGRWFVEHLGLHIPISIKGCCPPLRPAGPGLWPCLPIALDPYRWDCNWQVLQKPFFFS